MSSSPSVAKNSFCHLSAKSAGLVIGVFTIALVTRYLGRSGFGQYATALAWLQFFGILVDFGLYLMLLSEMGKAEHADDRQHVVGNLLLLRIISAGLVLAIAIALAWLMPYDRVIKLSIVILAAAFFFQLINQMLTGVFQAHLAMRRGSLIEVIAKFLGLVFLLIIIHLNGGLLWIVASVSFANLINTAIMWRWADRYTRLTLQLDWKYWRYLIGQSWPLAVIAVFNLLYFKTDTLILSWFYPSSVVGIYAAPYRVLEVLVSLPPVLLGLIMPRLSRALKDQDMPALRRAIERSLQAFHAITIPLLVGTLLLAKPIMVLIAGSAFAPSGHILAILIFAAVCIFYTQLFVYVIVAAGKQKKMLGYTVFVSLIALICYLIFIPRYSYMAAATITVASEAMMLLGYAYYTRYKLGIIWAYKRIGKIIIAALIMGEIIFWLRDLPTILVLVIGLVSYALAAVWLRILPLSDFHIINQ